MASSQKISLSMAKKIEILDALKTKKQVEVSKEFGVHKGTISKIKSAEKEIRQEALSNGNINRKRKRESGNEDVGEALIEWFHQILAQGGTVNGH